jgi:hypothetical protein
MAQRTSRVRYLLDPELDEALRIAAEKASASPSASFQTLKRTTGELQSMRLDVFDERIKFVGRELGNRPAAG